MSEYNPFAAPVGTALPQPTNSLVPSAFTPPIPAQMAPPPPPAPTAPPAPPNYDHPSMTLTELSFAPVAAPAAVEAPPAPPEIEDRLVNDILPAGGIARGLSLGRGRLPMIALVLIALLAAGGVVFGTGILKGDGAAPPVVKRNGLAGNGKLTGPLTEVKANTNTVGDGYAVTAPDNYVVTLGTVKPKAKTSSDIVIANATTGQKFTLSSSVDTLKRNDGPVAAAQLAKLKAAAIKRTKGMAVAGEASAVVAGVKATGFDLASSDGKTQTRSVFFVRRGTLYAASWTMATTSFKPSLNTFRKVLETVKFAADKRTANPPVKAPAAKK
jgi:hypothetical protein